jgi:hypothetical protein
MDHIEMLRFGLSGYRQEGVLKYMLLFILASVAYTLLSAALIGDARYDGNVGIVQMVLWFGLTIAMALVNAPIALRIAAGAMKKIGLPVHKDMLRELSFSWAYVSVRYVLYGLVWFIYMMLSWFEKKFLVALVAAVGFFAISISAFIYKEFIIGLVCLGISGIAFLAYSVVLARIWLRLMFVSNVFIQDPYGPLRANVWKAWNETSGKALHIFVALAVFFIAILLPLVFVVLLPYAALSFVEPTAAEVYLNIFMPAISVFGIYCSAYMYRNIVKSAKQKPEGRKAGRKKKR